MSTATRDKSLYLLLVFISTLPLLSAGSSLETLYNLSLSLDPLPLKPLFASTFNPMRHSFYPHLVLKRLYLDLALYPLALFNQSLHALLMLRDTLSHRI